MVYCNKHAISLLLFPCSYTENFFGLNYLFAACVRVVDLG